MTHNSSRSMQSYALVRAMKHDAKRRVIVLASSWRRGATTIMSLVEHAGRKLPCLSKRMFSGSR